MFNVRYLIITSVFLLFASCSDDTNNPDLCTDEFENVGFVEIRISNISSFDFSDILVDTNGGRHNFCSLASNQTTDYRKFTSAYRYAFVELKISGTVFTIQPIDFFGESLLSDGKYTYQINASDSEGRFDRLDLTLQTD